MTNLDTSTLLQVLQMLLGAGAVYGGIRAAISSMMRDIHRHDKEIDILRGRVDNHLETQHNRRRSD